MPLRQPVHQSACNADEVGFGDDADQFSVFHHGQAADTVSFHNIHGLHDGRIWRYGDRVLDHHILDLLGLIVVRAVFDVLPEHNTR